MFNYSDPTGGTTLDSSGAIAIYRSLVEREYQRGINVIGSEFLSLEDLNDSPDTPAMVDVEWPAFPLSNSGVSDSSIDANRSTFQDEYVEWDVERNTAGRVTAIKFTTLFPQYFVALGTVSEAALIQGIKGVIPAANPTTAELYGTADPGQLDTSQKRQLRISNFWSSSPWNNGTKGILSLIQGANTLGALTFLVGNCAVPRPSIPVGSVCTGPFCGSNRNSDPQVCAQTQSAVRSGLAVTLADPIGIEIVRLGGDWEIDGVPVLDIHANSTLWSVSLGGHRARLTVPEELTLDGDPIESGTQISRELFVKARVTGVPAASLPISPGTPELIMRRI